MSVEARFVAVRCSSLAVAAAVAASSGMAVGSDCDPLHRHQQTQHHRLPRDRGYELVRAAAAQVASRTGSCDYGATHSNSVVKPTFALREMIVRTDPTLLLLAVVTWRAQVLA